MLLHLTKIAYYMGLKSILHIGYKNVTNMFANMTRGRIQPGERVHTGEQLGFEILIIEFFDHFFFLFF